MGWIENDWWREKISTAEIGGAATKERWLHHSLISGKREIKYKGVAENKKPQRAIISLERQPNFSKLAAKKQVNIGRLSSDVVTLQGQHRQMSYREAAEHLEFSDRQVYRLMGRYQRDRDARHWVLRDWALMDLCADGLTV